MPFTSKQLADYVELINGYLDNLPVNIVEDFAFISQALETIAQPNHSATISAAQEDLISDIKDLVDNPDMYVENAENYPEFQAIIRAQITRKINEFAGMSSAQKERYILEQKVRKAQQQASSAEVAVRTAARGEVPVGSRTIEETEVQTLARRQREFEQEGVPAAIFTFHIAPVSPEVTRWLETGNMTLAQFLALAPALRSELIRHRYGVSALLNAARMSLAEFLALESALRTELILDGFAISVFLEVGDMSLAEFLALEPALRTELRANLGKVTSLLLAGRMSLEGFLGSELEPALRSDLINEADNIAHLLEVDNISLAQFLLLEPELITKLLEAGNSAVRFLQTAHISLEGLQQLELELRNELLENAFYVPDLLEAANLSLAELLAIKPPALRSELILDSRRITCLLKAGHISLEELLQLEPAPRAELLREADEADRVARLLEDTGVSPEQFAILLEAANVSVTQLLATRIGVRYALLRNYHSVITLMHGDPAHEAISFDQLVQMNRVDRNILLANPASPEAADIIAELLRPSPRGPGL